MGISPQSITVQDIANELREQASEHKRLERRHRALAQRSLATLRDLEALFRALGIPVERKERTQ